MDTLGKASRPAGIYIKTRTQNNLYWREKKKRKKKSNVFYLSIYHKVDSSSNGLADESLLT